MWSFNINMSAFLKKTVVLTFICLFVVSASYAQNTANLLQNLTNLAAGLDGSLGGSTLTDSTAKEELMEEILARKEHQQDSGALPAEISPIFFTDWEYAALKDAVNDRGKDQYTNTPTEQQIDRDKVNVTVNTGPVTGDSVDNIPPPPPEKRYISLHGIAYSTGDDWTIWLNGEQVTPKAIPHEIISLNVYDDYIEMKWYDDYTRQIYPLRLRSNQRFNLDTRIFLPG